MISVLAFSIGLGLVVALIFVELFAVTAGGLIVPGYVALYMGNPLDVALTFLAAGLTLLIVRSFSTFVVVYGRRRTVLMILTGFAVGMAMRSLLTVLAPDTHELAVQARATGGAPEMLLAELSVIGYIVPGLIAIWLDRQGVVVTFSSLIIVATVVRLLLMLLIPTELMWFEAAQQTAPPVSLPEEP